VARRVDGHHRRGGIALHVEGARHDVAGAVRGRHREVETAFGRGGREDIAVIDSRAGYAVERIRPTYAHRRRHGEGATLIGVVVHA